MADDMVLAEQLDYYRARAGEYDRWWFREGRFDHRPQAMERWFAEARALEAAPRYPWMRLHGGERHTIEERPEPREAPADPRPFINRLIPPYGPN